MIQPGDIYLMIFVGFVLTATVVVVVVFFLADRKSSRARRQHRDRSGIQRAVRRRRRKRSRSASDSDILDESPVPHE